MKNFLKWKLDGNKTFIAVDSDLRFSNASMLNLNFLNQTIVREI